jgi:hypothetical protein
VNNISVNFDVSISKDKIRMNNKLKRGWVNQLRYSRRDELFAPIGISRLKQNKILSASSASLLAPLNFKLFNWGGEKYFYLLEKRPTTNKH